MYKRSIDLGIAEQESCFLWGPRRTGKSTFLKERFPGARRYDLLQSDVYRRLLTRPALLREECGDMKDKGPVIIDEVQKVPDLLDEVHGLIEDRGLRFILCGSSARKLKHGHANLLGGRAVRCEMFPLVYPEIPDFSLEQALSCGLLPRHYLSAHPGLLLRSYVGDYLEQEIVAESAARNIPAFSRFLEVAALSNGEMINYQNIARECGVSAPTVTAYFQLLEDTLMGKVLPAFTRRAKRRLIGAPKFYFFDVGIVGELTRRGRVRHGSEAFGRAFEHFIFMELRAHAGYRFLNYPLSYWRTASQFEIDFVLGDHEVAIEVKGTDCAQDHHLKGLRAFKEEYKSSHYIAVTCDPKPRKTSDGIDILPWQVFLERLWSDKLVK